MPVHTAAVGSCEAFHLTVAKVGSKIIDVFICKLRKKLSVATGGKNYIETVWGRGYVLREPDEHEAFAESSVA